MRPFRLKLRFKSKFKLTSLGQSLGLFLILGALINSISPARADFYLHNWENHHESKSLSSLQFKVMYFNSGSNFDATGNSSSPATLQWYGRIQNDLSLAYGISQQLTVYGRISWAYINQNSTLRPGSAFGLADQTVGINWRAFHFENLYLDLQAQLDFPAYSTTSSENNLTPYLGDGTADATAGFLATIPISKKHNESMNILAGAGYTRRSAGFSSALPWTLQFQYRPLDTGIFAQVGGMGIGSFKTDDFTNTVLRSSAGAGGSYFIGATNPSLIQLDTLLGYKFNSQVELNFSFLHGIWGQNSPNGLTIAMGLQVRMGKASRANPFLLGPKKYGHSNNGFLNYSLDAKILRSTDSLSLVKINKGSQDGIEVDQIFDLFYTQTDGSAGESIARARASSVRPNETALEITEFYREVSIEEGFIAKRLIQ